MISYIWHLKIWIAYYTRYYNAISLELTGYGSNDFPVCEEITYQGNFPDNTTIV